MAIEKGAASGLSGRVAVVTGGIGAATVPALAAEGAMAGFSGRNEEMIAALEAEASAGGIRGIAADISIPE